MEEHCSSVDWLSAWADRWAVTLNSMWGIILYTKRWFVCHGWPRRRYYNYYYLAVLWSPRLLCWGATMQEDNVSLRVSAVGCKRHELIESNRCLCVVRCLLVMLSGWYWLVDWIAQWWDTHHSFIELLVMLQGSETELKQCDDMHENAMASTTTSSGALVPWLYLCALIICWKHCTSLSCACYAQ